MVVMLNTRKKKPKIVSVIVVHVYVAFVNSFLYSNVKDPASHFLFVYALIAIFAHDKILVTDNRAILIIC